MVLNPDRMIDPLNPILGGDFRVGLLGQFENILSLVGDIPLSDLLLDGSPDHLDTIKVRMPSWCSKELNSLLRRDFIDLVLRVLLDQVLDVFPEY